MPQIVQTNISSLNTQRNLNTSLNSLSTALQRLSTGYRVNSAKDDAAGLAISNRMSAQIQGLSQAQRNANDGVSLSQSAEAGLSTIGESLLRIRELAIQSANATNSASDRAALQAEVNERLQEITRISTDTEFNGLKLFDGGFTSQSFHIGANANQTVEVSMQEVSSSTLGLESYTAVSDDVQAGTGASSLAAPGPLATNASNTIAAQVVTLGGNFGTQDVQIGAGNSCKQIADAVNAQSNATGIKAVSETDCTLGSFTAGIVTFGLATDSQGGFETISVNVSVNDVSNLARAINDVSGQIGVTAVVSDDGSSVVLSNREGHNIIINEFTHTSDGASVDVTTSDGNTQQLFDDDGGGPGTDVDSTVISGVVTFNSNKTFSVQSDTADTAGGIADLAADVSDPSVLETLASVDLSTTTSAQSAIDVIDASLDTLNQIRGELGAIQNRFEGAIVNMSAVSENLSAARSRILDADFAQESAALSRGQILQQAGISILGQANALPQNALSLLEQ